MNTPLFFKESLGEIFNIGIFNLSDALVN